MSQAASQVTRLGVTCASASASVLRDLPCKHIFENGEKSCYSVQVLCEYQLVCTYACPILSRIYSVSSPFCVVVCLPKRGKARRKPKRSPRRRLDLALHVVPRLCFTHALARTRTRTRTYTHTYPARHTGCSFRDTFVALFKHTCTRPVSLDVDDLAIVKQDGRPTARFALCHRGARPPARPPAPKAHCADGPGAAHAGTIFKETDGRTGQMTWWAWRHKTARRGTTSACCKPWTCPPRASPPPP